MRRRVVRSRRDPVSLRLRLVQAGVSARRCRRPSRCATLRAVRRTDVLMPPCVLGFPCLPALGGARPVFVFRLSTVAAAWPHSPRPCRWSWLVPRAGARTWGCRPTTPPTGPEYPSRGYDRWRRLLQRGAMSQRSARRKQRRYQHKPHDFSPLCMTCQPWAPRTQTGHDGNTRRPAQDRKRNKRVWVACPSTVVPKADDRKPAMALPHSGSTPLPATRTRATQARDGQRGIMN